MKDFDRDLERGLHDLFDPYLAEHPGPWRTRARASAPVRVAGGLGGALALKLASGAVIAALAAGAGVEAVNTHSLNPVDWGRAVSRQVQSVRAPAASSPATVHASTSPAATGHSPAATPVTSAPALSPPAVSPLPLPTVSPISIPTVKPTSLPTIP